MEIQDLFNTDVEIPSLPDIYYKFKEAMDDPEGSFDEISDIITTDPGRVIVKCGVGEHDQAAFL